MMSDHSWVKRAKCRGVSLEVFFPSSVTEDRYDLAKSVCASCDVTDECLGLVIDLPDHDDRFGIFGGLSPHERLVLRQTRAIS